MYFSPKYIGLLALAFIVCATASLAPAPVHAKDDMARIANVTVTEETPGELTLGFEVVGKLEKRIFDTLDSGLPVGFTFQVNLVPPPGLFIERVLLERQFTRVIEKDNLTNQFIIRGQEKTQRLDTLGEALKEMLRVEGYPLVSRAMLAEAQPLKLRLRVQFEKFRLPFALHRLFFFVSYWDLETDWYEMDLSADKPKGE